MAPLVNKRCTAVSIDTTDISKNHTTKKMPFIAPVHDGSRNEIRPGWTLYRADGVAKNGATIPLHIQTFSREAPEYRGDQQELRDFLDTIVPHLKSTTMYLFDAGNDGRTYRSIFRERNLRHTVRLKIGATSGGRVIWNSDGHALRLRDTVNALPMTSRYMIRRYRKRQHKTDVGWMSGVRFTDRHGKPEREAYSIVVTRNFGPGKEPVVLATTDVVRTDAQAHAIVEHYADRWAVESGHDVLKECFDLENIRVLKWRSFKRLVHLCHVAWCFMAWLVHTADGLELAKRAPVFGPVPRLPYERVRMTLGMVLVS